MNQLRMVGIISRNLLLVLVDLDDHPAMLAGRHKAITSKISLNRKVLSFVYYPKYDSLTIYHVLTNKKRPARKNRTPYP